MTENEIKAAQKQFKHFIGVELEGRAQGWVRDRGGIAVWGCLDLSDPSRQWTGALHQENGKRAPKPHWAATEEPILTFTPETAHEIGVVVTEVFKEFKIALKPSGRHIKLTQHSSKKLNQALQDAGLLSTYEFGYLGSEPSVRILRPVEIRALRGV